MAMKIVQAECTGCGVCEPECPTSSIVEKGGIYKVSKDTCTECKDEAESPMCVKACPDGDNCFVHL